MKKKLLPIFIIIATCLFAVQWVRSSGKADLESRQLNEKTNLALRQVGHELLSKVGNHTSTIPPIKQIGASEFVLRLEDSIRYEALPLALSSAFSNYDITGDYQVAVKKCDTDTIILGYNFMTFEFGNIPCRGREQQSTCNDISVTFLDDNTSSDNLLLATSGLLALSLLLVWLYLFFQKKKTPSEAMATPPPPPAAIDGNKISINQCSFDFNNQVIEVNGDEKKLTFRENKLLYFFFKQPNQILERETILSSVWGDEGVVVSRSLDVFVSRLRKILKEDESIKIKNVHGVGYRLEVSK